jgi:hypothetical protein
VKQSDASPLEVSQEDLADSFRFLKVDDELSLCQVAPQRNVTAHPDTFLLRRSNFVADSLSGNLPLKLCEGE